MCGIKNFVSVRLYSAPQSHWTIVSILGICADGGVDQTEIDRHIQRSLLPPSQRRPGSLPGGRRSARQLCVIPTGGTNVPTAEWGACVGQEQCGRYIYPDKVGHTGNASYLLGQTGRAARRISRRGRCRRRHLAQPQRPVGLSKSRSGGQTV